jgi:hypothetical protein
VAIEDAVAPPAPKGSPSVITAQAATYARTAAECGAGTKDFDAAATNSLPQARCGRGDRRAGGRRRSAEHTGPGRARVGEVGAGAGVRTGHRRGRGGDPNDAESSFGFLGVEVWNLSTAGHEALEGVNLRITAAQQV